MKKIHTFIIILILVFAIPADAQSNSLFFNLDKNTFLNNQISWDLKLATSSLVMAVQIDIEFDPLYLELASSTPNNDICELIAVDNINNSEGKYSLVCGNPKASTSTDVITTLTFDKIQTGWTNLRITNAYLFTPDNPIDNLIEQTGAERICLQ